MSILDTFFVLFKSDTSDLEKGHAKADKLGDDYLKKNKERWKEIDKNQKLAAKNQEILNDATRKGGDEARAATVSFLDMAIEAAAALGAVVTLGTAVHSVFDTEREVLQLGRFSKALGLNAGEIYQWSRAVKDIAGENADISADIKQLADNLNSSIVIGGGIVQMPMNEFTQGLMNNGIALLNNSKQIKNWSDVFIAEAEKVDQMRKAGLQDAQINAFLRNQLHLSEATALFIQQGSAAVREQLAIVKSQGIPSQEDVDRVMEFAKAWGILVQNIEQMGIHVAGPVLDFLNNMPKLISEGKDKLDSFTTALGVVATIFGVLYTEAIVAFGAMIVSLLVAMSPLIAFIGALGLLYLAIEKLKHTEGFKVLGGWADDLGASVDWLTTKIGKVAAAMAILADPQFKGQKWQMINDVFSDDENPVDNSKGGEKHSSLVPDQTQMMAAAKATIDVAARTPISAQTSSSIINGNSSSLANNVTVEEVIVNTQATDPNEIAVGIGDALHKHINHAISNFDNGIHS